MQESKDSETGLCLINPPTSSARTDATCSFVINPIAFAVCAGIIAACGLQYLAVAGICFTVTLIIAQYLKTQLGGLTGDTYGALTECGNVIYLLTAVFLLR